MLGLDIIDGSQIVIEETARVGGYTSNQMKMTERKDPLLNPISTPTIQSVRLLKIVTLYDTTTTDAFPRL